jgi:transcriptional regulator of met regulon
MARRVSSSSTRCRPVCRLRSGTEEELLADAIWDAYLGVPQKEERAKVDDVLARRQL